VLHTYINYIYLYLHYMSNSFWNFFTAYPYKYPGSATSTRYFFSSTCPSFYLPVCANLPSNLMRCSIGFSLGGVRFRWWRERWWRGVWAVPWCRELLVLVLMLVLVLILVLVSRMAPRQQRQQPLACTFVEAFQHKWSIGPAPSSSSIYQCLILLVSSYCASDQIAYKRH
jgi:hypothetical protein